MKYIPLLIMPVLCGVMAIFDFHFKLYTCACFLLVLSIWWSFINFYVAVK